MHLPRFASALLLFSPLFVSAVLSRGELDPVTPPPHLPAPGPVSSATPITFFSFDSPQMTAWAEQPRNNAVLTGRLLNLPAGEAGTVSIFYSLNTLGPDGQVKKNCVLEPDGTFRIELEPTFPWQNLYLNIKPYYFGGILLSRDLHVEIDVQNLPDRNAKEPQGVVFSGSDRALNEEARRFVFFARDRKAAIGRAISEAEREGKVDFATRLATLTRLKRESEELVREFSPQIAGAYFQNEIDGKYYSAVLWAAARAKYKLQDEPIWEEIVRHPSYAVTNDQAAYYRGLSAYLRMSMVHRVTEEDLLQASKSAETAAPDVQDAYRSATKLLQSETNSEPPSPELRSHLDKLQQAGLISFPSIEIRHVDQAGRRLSAAKLDLVHLFLLPKDPEAARLMIAELRRVASNLWMRSYLDRYGAVQQARLDEINVALAQARSGPQADSLGELMRELPSGARLYHLPTLSGQELLARLAKAYPDKALILDFWGPWCTPCLNDIPYSQKTHEALKDAPVEFIYFGSRTEEGPWLRTIAELHLSGTHILLERKQVDELMTFFKGTGYPTYVFIDRKGKVQPGAISWFRRTTPEDIRRLLE